MKDERLYHFIWRIYTIFLKYLHIDCKEAVVIVVCHHKNLDLFVLYIQTVNLSKGYYATRN